jgi:hypothetical protein
MKYSKLIALKLTFSERVKGYEFDIDFSPKNTISLYLIYKLKYIISLEERKKSRNV